jgi:hypothetical protein
LLRTSVASTYIMRFRTRMLNEKQNVLEASLYNELLNKNALDSELYSKVLESFN